jgi:hypothetical protein
MLLVNLTISSVGANSRKAAVEEAMERQVVSIERLTDVLDWVRDVLGPLDGAVADGGIEQTTSSVGCLESIREHVRKGDDAFSAAEQIASSRAQEYRLLADAGFHRAAEVADNLDAAVLADLETLAALMANLAVPMSDTQSPAKCMALLASAAGHVLGVRAEAFAEEADASTAVEQLLSASDDLRNMEATFRSASKEAIEAALVERKDRERAIQMDAKTEQYEDEAMELKVQVRSTGITGDTTHDAVLASSREVEEMEAYKCALAEKLAIFQNLPAVSADSTSLWGVGMLFGCDNLKIAYFDADAAIRSVTVAACSD